MNSFRARAQGYNPNQHRWRHAQDSSTTSESEDVSDSDEHDVAPHYYNHNPNDNNNNVINPNDNNNNVINPNNIWPTGAQVRNFIEQEANPNDDKEIKLGWQTLLQQKTAIPNSTNDWFPFPNALYLFLFIGRYDASLAITRNIINFFIKILKTLQDQGHLDASYKMPGDGSEIERLWTHLPQLPLSK